MESTLGPQQIHGQSTSKTPTNHTIIIFLCHLHPDKILRQIPEADAIHLVLGAGEED